MIYLDSNAGARLRPEAAEAIKALVNNASAITNPSSVHDGGRRARTLLSDARGSVLSLLGADTGTLFFTSGGTEACNTLVKGFLGDARGVHIVTSTIEHPAMKEVIKNVGAGKETWVHPSSNGIVEVDKFCAAVRADTALVSLMLVNNETGAVQNLIQIAKKLRANGYHGVIISDITQAVGKLEFSVNELFTAGVNGVAMSGHKLGAPAGIGAVILSEDKEVCFPFEPTILGGPQEKRFRGGTENLYGAVALGEVSRAVNRHLDESISEINARRMLLWSLLCEEVGELLSFTPGFGGVEGRSICNTLMVGFDGCRGDDLVVALDLQGVAASTGSACSSGRQEVSEVLLSQGISKKVARGAIRLSIDWSTTDEEIQQAALIIAKIVSQMQEGERKYG